MARGVVYALGLAGVVAGAAGFSTPVAAADNQTEVADQPSTQLSGPTVGGTSTLANATVTITLPNTTVITTTTDNGGRWRKVLPKGTKGKVDVIITKPGNPNRDVGSANVASLGAPPGTTGMTVATVSAGSTAKVGAASFALTGGFTAIDTAADYNPLSPTYGQVSGFVPAGLLSLSGSDGQGNTLALTLAGDATFSLDLASVWSYIDANGDVAGQTAAITVAPVSGTALYNGNPLLFTGTVGGTETFGDPPIDPSPTIGLDPAIDTYNLTFDLAPGAGGPITGTILASGPETLIAEPGSLGVLAAGLLGALAVVRRRPRRR